MNDPQASSEDVYSWMESYAESYLKSQTVAGSILNKETTLEHEEGFCRLRAQYACLEMIGKVKDEELIQK